jgi:hypothetical protein
MYPEQNSKQLLSMKREEQRILEMSFFERGVSRDSATRK